MAYLYTFYDKKISAMQKRNEKVAAYLTEIYNFEIVKELLRVLRVFKQISPMMHGIHYEIYYAEVHLLVYACSRMEMCDNATVNNQYDSNKCERGQVRATLNICFKAKQN